MNKRGFTLIEGLLVIAIIGVLLLTLIPSVITIINKNKIKQCESTRDSILMAAKMYVAENKYSLSIDCNGSSTSNPKIVSVSGITLNLLKEYGKLADKELDSRFPNSVGVTYNCETKEFTYAYDVSCES